MRLTPRPLVRRGTPVLARARSREQAGNRPAGRLGPLLYLFPGYLLLLVAAEVLTLQMAPVLPALGPVLYGMVLALLLLHAALCWDQPFRCLPLVLSLAPLARLLLFWPAVHRLPGLEYCLALGLPLLAVGVAAINLALPLGRAAEPASEETRGVASVAPKSPDLPGLPRYRMTAVPGAVLRRVPGGRPAPLRRAVVQIGQSLQAAWSRRPDRRLVHILQAAWTGRPRGAGWSALRDRAVLLRRYLWGAAANLRRALVPIVPWLLERSSMAAAKLRHAIFLAVPWLLERSSMAAAKLRHAIFRAATWLLERRSTAGALQCASLVARRCQVAVDRLALLVAARVDGAGRGLDMRLRYMRRTLPRWAQLPWAGVACAAMLFLLFAARLGVAVATAGQAVLPGRLDSAPRALTIGGWTTGFLAGGSRAVAGLPRGAEDRPAAAAPTPSAVPTEDVVAAVVRIAAPMPPTVAEDRPPRPTWTPVPPPPTFTPTPVPPSPVPAPAPAPAFPAECPGGGYDNIYPWGVCTWYAKAMRPDLPWFWGDYGMADNWGYSARACGFVVDTEPAPGAVIVFSPFANGASARGHVGYVEEVGLDYVLFSECNAGFESYYAEEPFWWEGGYPCIHRRIPRDQLDPGIEYIHGRVDAEEEP